MTILGTTLLASVQGACQNPPLPAPVPAQDSTPILHSNATLVLVPTLVLSPTGDLIHNLTPEDFHLTDNGIPQQAVIEDSERQPLAIVVLLQTGGAARAQLPNYQHLGPMIEALTGQNPHKVALITFDSAPEELWNFPPQVDGLSEAFTHPDPGDDGAALLDATSRAIDLLAEQAPESRRIILLFSQPHDQGSRTTPETVVRRLAETNTTLYSLTFSPERKWVHDQFAGDRHENKPYTMPGQQNILHTFDLGTPIAMAWRALRTDTAANLATLSGGEHLTFTNRHDLDQQLSTLTNHLPNLYTLSFRPTTTEPGFHTLKVVVLHQPHPPEVSARSGYWAR
jgi:VWFA-related protein